MTNQNGLAGIPSVDFSVASRQHQLQPREALARGEEKGFLDARNTSSQAIENLENQVAQWENAECAIAFSSGMAAISAVLMALLAPKKRVVVGKDTYGGATALLTQTLPQWGVDVEMVDSTDETDFFKAMQAGCDLLAPSVGGSDFGKVLNKLKLVLSHRAQQSRPSYSWHTL